MRVTSLIAVPLFIALAAASARASSPAPAALDRARVHAEYQNGDFDKVIKDLEAFQKSGRRASRSDSVFIAKHLAVVYAANPDTRERGRYYMLRMLDMAPDSDLLDMFVGEEVGAVFEKSRKEFEMMAEAAHSVAKARLAAPVPANAATPAPLFRASRSAEASPRAARLREEAPATSAAYRAAPPAASTPRAAPSATGAFAARPAIASAVRFSPVTAPDIRPRNLPVTQPAAPAVRGGSTEGAAEAAPDYDAFLEGTEAGPEWKGAAKWVGGGVALAVIGLTLYFAKADDEAPAKTYVVPKN